MKNILPLALCLFVRFLFAQNPTLDTVAQRLGEVPETRALVIGISDYKDSLIGDLHFAHKDAEIFADYLRSEAGGALPDQDIWLMTNQEATLGAIDNALTWLLKETRKGDKVIIYFSGHGDVERLTLWQRGYLLAYNTPSRNYRNNAVRVEELDEIIKTLSVGMDAKVVVILDACRAGKLAGTGPDLTAQQLEKQVRNEVRILSCRPEQKSLESELWGAGRGLFSYYFINGIKGMADQPPTNDKVVTLEELKFFLEENMGKALQAIEKPLRQNPVFVGDELYTIATVNDKMLKMVTSEIASVDKKPTTGPNRKGLMERGADTNHEAELTGQLQDIELSALVLQPDFEALLKTNDPSALLSFFSKNLGLEGITDDQLRQQAQLALAARLHDQAQDVINLYLQGDARTLDQRNYIDQAEKYVQYPRMLQAALILLPKGHLLRRNVEVKLHYFEGVCARLAARMSNDKKWQLKEAFVQQEKALALDDKAAYVHNELGLLYLAENKLDKAEKYFMTAAELAPNWALPHNNLSAVLLEKNDLPKAESEAKKAIALQPGFFGSYLNLGKVYEKAKDHLQAETMYRKARELNDPHYLPFERRAYLQLQTGRYMEANWQFYEMEMRKKGKVPPLKINVYAEAPMFNIDKPFEYPSLSGPGILTEQPKTAEAAFLSGKYYFEKGQMAQALPYFKQAMKMDAKHREVYYYLGKISQADHDYEAAEIYMKRLVELRTEVEYIPFFLADIYHDWLRPLEEEAIYRNFIYRSSDKRILTSAHLRLADLLHGQKRYSEEELNLWEFQELDRDWGNTELAIFYDTVVKAFPQNPDWMYRLADFDYRQSKHKLGIAAFEKLLKLDTAQAARAYIHSLAGDYYLKEGTKTKLAETDTSWAGDLPKAIAHLRQAAQLAPQLPSAKYDLAMAYEKTYEYGDALSVLEALRDSNDLDFNSRLLLVDLYARAGRFGAAKNLLDKALDIQPEAVVGLPGLAGKLAMLQGKTSNAIEFYSQEFDLAMLSSETSTLVYNKSENENYILVSNDSSHVPISGRVKWRSGDDENYDLATSTAYTLARLYALVGKKEECVKWLKIALNRGFDAALVLKYDPALDGLRGDSQFNELLTKYKMN